MCLSPVHIKNKSRRYVPGCDAPVLDVPCGHCKECQKESQNEWRIRAIFEYKNCIKKGGYVLFPTLTYRNEDLPFWHDDEYNFTCQVFDKSHFKAFRNKLRMYLKREGYNCKESNSIRYFYSCEYGGKKGRSHLHTLLFFPSIVPVMVAIRLVKKAWIYGFVRYSPKGVCVQSVKGVSYVMKYLAKDMVFYDTYKIDDYLAKLKSDAYHDGKFSLKHHDKLLRFKKHLPHHCQSLSFGGCYNPTDEQFIDNVIKSDVLDLYDESSFTFKLPKYYFRKFLYSYDKENSLLVLNERGKEIKIKSFNKVVDRLEKYLISALDFNKVTLMDSILETQGFNLPCYYDYVRMLEYDTHDIAVFMLVYRYRYLPKETILEYDMLSCDRFLRLMDMSAFDSYCDAIFSKDFVQPVEFGQKVQYELLPGYNETNIYKVFYHGLVYVDSIYKEFGKLKQKNFENDLLMSQIQFGNNYSYLNDF